MINGLFDQPYYVAAKKMMDLTTLRQEAISSNLANIETPNYKRLDVDQSFSKELQQAIAHQNVSRVESLQPEIKVDPRAQAANRDGNTVQLDQELMALNQNFLEHTVETRVITETMARLKMAITGKIA